MPTTAAIVHETGRRVWFSTKCAARSICSRDVHEGSTKRAIFVNLFETALTGNSVSCVKCLGGEVQWTE